MVETSGTTVGNLFNSARNAAGTRSPINNSFQSLRFPQEVGTEQVPAWIRFEPVEYEYGTLENYGNSFGNSGGSVFANTSTTNNYSALGNSSLLNNLTASNFSFNRGPLNITVQNPIGGIVQNLVTGAENYISNLTGGLVTANISTIFNNTTSIISGRVDISSALTQTQRMRIGRTTSFSQGSINLYLPNKLDTKTGVDVKTGNLGAAGAAVINSLRDFQNTGVTGNTIANSITDILANTLVEYTARNEKLRTGLAIAEGIVANNYSYAVFNSVRHREFSYTFKLIAKNEAEAEEIKRICDMFIYFMLPNKIQAQAFSFFEIPAAWKIRYYYNNEEMKYHLQPKECFLKDVNVTYGGESLNALHNNGAPLEVELSLSFIEIEPLYRESTTVTNRYSLGGGDLTSDPNGPGLGR